MTVVTDLIAEREKLLDAIETVYNKRGGLSGAITESQFRWIDSIVERLAKVKNRVDFLEIGSFMGVSNVVFGSTLRRHGVLGSMVSIDPYYEGGYLETVPWRQQDGPVRHESDVNTMRKALLLYKECGFDVRLIRVASKEGLCRLLLEQAQFDLIFVDGDHEGLAPMTDVAFSLCLLRPDSYIILDDSFWPDIRPVRGLCEKHLIEIGAEGSKVCYLNTLKAQRLER
jgi:predicted O-methyltransferase YrrM